MGTDLIRFTPAGRAMVAALDLEKHFPALAKYRTEVAAVLFGHFEKACALPAVPADFPPLPAPHKEDPNGSSKA